MPFALCLGMLGCGANLDYKQARYLDSTGQIHRALAAYEEFIKDYPDDPRAMEVRYLQAIILSEKMNRCSEAVPLLESVARDPDPARAQRAEMARLGLLSCPDYFPLEKGASWLYVDSASGGEFMRLEIGVYAASANVRGLVTGEMFAGKRMIQQYKRNYTKEGWAIFEKIGEVKAPILKYPFHTGRTWKVLRGGRTEVFTIVDSGLDMTVKAGRYNGCLKVRRQTPGDPSWVYDYYCAGVGRVKTTIGVSDGENPNTELARYKPTKKS